MQFGLVLKMSLIIGPMGMSAATMPVSVVDNRPFVEVRINGKGPFSFLLDTGSSVTTVSTALSRSLGLRSVEGGEGLGAGDKPVPFKVVHVESVKVGSVSLGPMDAPTMDEKKLSQVIGFRRFDGVLGAEIFKARGVTLDTFRGRLSLDLASRVQVPDGAVAIPFLLDENDMPIVQASVNGVSGSFQVDTGDRSSLTLFGPFWREHNLDKQVGSTIKAMTGYGAGGPILAIVGRSKEVTIGSITVPSPLTRLSLQTGGTFIRGDRAGSIGMGILRRFVVTFDYLHHVMWLSKGRAFDVPDHYDRSGMWLGLTNRNGLQVVSVTPDSPAARAGVRVGDLVKRVGAISATEANLFAIRHLLEEPDLHAVSVSATRDLHPYKTRIAMRDQVAASSLTDRTSSSPVN